VKTTDDQVYNTVTLYIYTSVFPSMWVF